MADDPVDVAALVAEIESDVARRRAAGEYPEDLLRLLEAEFNPREDEAPELLAVVGTPRPAVSKRRFVGPAVVLIKRALRRSMAWYVQPIASEQTRFNLALLREFRRVERELERLRTPWPAGQSWLDGISPSDAEVEHRVALIARSLEGARPPILIAGAPTKVLDGLTAALWRREFKVCRNPVEVLDTAAPQTIGAVVLDGVLPRLAPAELLGIVPAAMAALRPGGQLIIGLPISDGADVLARRAIATEAAISLCEFAGASMIRHVSDSRAGWGLVTAVASSS